MIKLITEEHKTVRTEINVNYGTYYFALYYELEDEHAFIKIA
jgi:hypothetical protein